MFQWRKDPKTSSISWKLWFSLESSFLDTWENVSKGYNQCIFSFLGSLLHLPFLMRQETLMKTISGKAGFRPFYWYQNNCVAWGKWTKNHWGLLNIWKRILNVLYPNYYSLTPLINLCPQNSSSKSKMIYFYPAFTPIILKFCVSRYLEYFHESYLFQIIVS